MSPSFCGIIHYHIGFEIEVKYAEKKITDKDESTGLHRSL